MTWRRAFPAVALLMLALQTQAYIGRAARFLRNRLYRPGNAAGLERIALGPGNAPLPSAEPALAAPRTGVPSPSRSEAASESLVDGPALRAVQLRPVQTEAAPLQHLWQLYDRAVESVLAQSSSLLGDKQRRIRYPGDTFLSSSTLRQCRALSSCPTPRDGAFDVVGFMEVDTRRFLEASGDASDVVVRPVKPRKSHTKAASKAPLTNNMLYWKRSPATKAPGLPVTKLRAR